MRFYENFLRLSWPVLGAVLLLASPAAAAGPVDEAITKGQAFLFKEMNTAGNWEEAVQPLPDGADNVRNPIVQSPLGGQWGGRTSLALYALLASGADSQDPRLERAVTFVKTADLRGTYALGLRMLALTYLPRDEQVMTVLRRDTQLLLQTVKTQGNAAGHFDYNVSYRNDPKLYSHSRSQYGILGVHAAARAGVEVTPDFWRLVDIGWRRNQDPTGGWRYQHPDDQYKTDVTPGMTAAGVASLFLCAEMLQQGVNVGCRGNFQDRNIDAGLAWLAQNFEATNPEEEFDRDYPFATLYNLERVGVASGLRYVGENDWYERGSQWLVATQRRNGSWGDSGGSIDRMLTGVPDTAFALLFLARGRSPVMANKLAYTVDGKPGTWNQRPRDLANVVDFTAKALERELHWFIVDETRPVEDWLEAPILYIAGDATLNISDQLKEKLRAYAHRGGLIVVNADCGRRAFTESAKALFEDIFDPYAFRVPGADHPFFTVHYPLANARRVPNLLMLGNGAREFVIIVPTQDLGRDWQRGTNETALQLGANLFAYAVDRTHARTKGQPYWLEPDLTQKPSKSLAVGRMMHPGNWNPEPAGWDHLTVEMHNRYDVQLDVRPIDPTADSTDGLDVLHLTGTGAFEPDEQWLDSIKQFIDAGGLLIVDAAGGDAKFAGEAEVVLRTLLADEAGQLDQPLPADHPLYGEMEGLPPLEVAYRLDAQATLGNANTPQLRVFQRDDRPAIVFSSLDLSVGLVGHPVAGVIGYAPHTATALMARLLHDRARE